MNYDAWSVADLLGLARWYDSKAREHRARRSQAGPNYREQFTETIKECEAKADRLRSLARQKGRA